MLSKVESLTGDSAEIEYPILIDIDKSLCHKVGLTSLTGGSSMAFTVVCAYTKTQCVCGLTIAAKLVRRG